MRDGYGIDEVVDPMIEHMHSLGEFQSALANSMDCTGMLVAHGIAR